MSITMNGVDSLSELIAAFEATSLSLQEKKGVGKQPLRLLPSPLQIYQVGKLLYETQEKQSSSGGSETYETLLTSYQSLLEQLPVSYLRDVLFHDINLAFSKNQTAASATSSGLDSTSTTDAVHSICGLYSDTPLACRMGFSIAMSKSICVAYSSMMQRNRDHECKTLLKTISLFLLESGLFDKSNDSYDDEAAEETRIQGIMEVVQALTEDQHNTCLGDMIEWQEQTIPSRAIPGIVTSTFEETPQREYLLLMLTSAPRSSPVQQQQTLSQMQPCSQQHESVPLQTVSAASEIQRRIQLVHDVLPELGGGYVEAALSCFQGDVDRTVAALLEAQSDAHSLPPVLQMMDPKLPKRHTETTPDSYALDDDEARRITKARLADMERTQEAEAYALAVVGSNDEYNDDYDDQYDGLDGGAELGGGDGETYDVDLDTIRTYNRAAMAAAAEDSFWEESRNLNGEKQKKGHDNDGVDRTETKQFRGPDKAKGGRAIGSDGKYLPIKKGGKKAKAKQNEEGSGEKGNANASSDRSKERSKLQQKRKDKNKAKIANHHRKERAQKKAAQGM